MESQGRVSANSGSTTPDMPILQSGLNQPITPPVHTQKAFAPLNFLSRTSWSLALAAGVLHLGATTAPSAAASLLRILTTVLRTVVGDNLESIFTFTGQALSLLIHPCKSTSLLLPAMQSRLHGYNLARNNTPCKQSNDLADYSWSVATCDYGYGLHTDRAQSIPSSSH